LVLAIENGIGTIVVDNLYEIEMIENICRALDKTQKVLLRTNPGVEAHTHSFIQTSKIDSKFGFALRNEETIQAINAINNTTCVKFAGFHCHIGSQIFDKNAFSLAVEIVTDYVKMIKETYNIEVDELNFGGGFGVHYSGDDPKFSINDYCQYIETLTKTLTSAVERKNIKKPFFMIEPGRSIVGEAGITLYSVGAIKEIKGIKKYL
ncbi:MAG: diaminopimelate decarboxylase, partial [Clostridia bacterium]